MNPKVLKYLLDIQNSIELTDTHLSGIMSYDAFLANITVRRAIDYEFTIIGEALNNALKVEPELAKKITDTRRIVALRNYLIHSYDNVNPATIWSIIQNNLPVLKSEIAALL